MRTSKKELISDELKPFHPQVDDIAKYYPQYYKQPASSLIK